MKKPSSVCHNNKHSAPSLAQMYRRDIFHIHKLQPSIVPSFTRRRQMTRLFHSKLGYLSQPHFSHQLIRDRNQC